MADDEQSQKHQSLGLTVNLLSPSKIATNYKADRTGLKNADQ